MEKPKSIFDLEYFETREEAQEALDAAFSGEGPLHLPSCEDVKRVREQLVSKGTEYLTDHDVLIAFQDLRKSAMTSDIICGDTSSGSRCGGLMDFEVNAFGVYYLCRLNNRHKIAK